MPTATTALSLATTLLLSLSGPISAMPMAIPSCAVGNLQINGTYICESQSLRYDKNSTEYANDEETFRTTFSMFNENTFAKQGECIDSTAGCTTADNTTVTDSLVCVIPGFEAIAPGHIAHCRSVDGPGQQSYYFTCDNDEAIKFSVSMYEDDASMPTVVASGTCTRSSDASPQRRGTGANPTDTRKGAAGKKIVLKESFIGVATGVV